MHLPHGREPNVIGEQSKKTPAVLGNILMIVLVKTREVEIARRKRRDAAEPCREPVQKAAVLDLAANEHLDTIAFSPIKALIC